MLFNMFENMTFWKSWLKVLLSLTWYVQANICAKTKTWRMSIRLYKPNNLCARYTFGDAVEKDAE